MHVLTEKTILWIDRQIRKLFMNASDYGNTLMYITTWAIKCRL